MFPIYREIYFLESYCFTEIKINVIQKLLCRVLIRLLRSKRLGMVMK